MVDPYHFSCLCRKINQLNDTIEPLLTNSKGKVMTFYAFFYSFWPNMISQLEYLAGEI